MIDLHLHTTASDGRLTPGDLVARAAAARITVMSVTDHDTVASIDEATALAERAGIRMVPGIEITAVLDGRDVHVLGYFVNHRSEALAAFLTRQRGLRLDRVREIGARLAALGVPVDIEDVLRPAAKRPGVAVGRPWIARALVAEGHATSVQDAFDRYLGAGQAAYVPRTGCSPAAVVKVVHETGGVASMAHPGVTRRDDLIAPLALAGLDALEVYHSDHTPEMQDTYRQMAARLGLATSGGSDFHGFGETRETLGVVSLPAEAFAALEARRR